LAEQSSNTPRQHSLDGIVPEAIVDRTERLWLMAMAGMLVVMLAVVVTTGIVDGLHPPSNVEVVDPTTLHLQGEFVQSNLGTAVEPDGSVTVRIVAEQYAFVPHCVRVPAATPVKFRLTSAEAVHDFLLSDTNVNAMVVPGFATEVRTSFAVPGEHAMPCRAFCGFGHQAMWAHVSVVPRQRFSGLSSVEGKNCTEQ
jgi:cytochrome c oxidase subunit II